ncbi:MAG: LysM peptidoglycan-binding domain-containing protein [Actinomycetota bacterium]
MRFANPPAISAFGAPLAIGALVLASCGGGEVGGAAESTIDLSQASTDYVERPPETTLAPDGAGGSEVVTGSQDYTVQAGDYPLKVANDFGITVDDLVAFNDWGSVNEFPFPGTVIRIPPGANAPSASSDDAETAADAGSEADAVDDASADGGDEETAAPVETIPDAGDNCGEGTYTIAAGDLPIRVAENFDVTVDALDAANANTDGYGAFIVGLEIIIPAKADC